MEGFLSLFLLAFLAFVGFVIYFIFKQLEFVIRAIKLYLRMISRLDMIIKLLAEIRGGPPVAIPADEDPEDGIPAGTTPNKTRCGSCGAISERGTKFCEQCGANLLAD